MYYTCRVESAQCTSFRHNDARTLAATGIHQNENRITVPRGTWQTNAAAQKIGEHEQKKVNNAIVHPRLLYSGRILCPAGVWFWSNWLFFASHLQCSPCVSFFASDSLDGGLDTGTKLAVAFVLHFPLLFHVPFFVYIHFLVRRHSASMPIFSMNRHFICAVERTQDPIK